MDRPPERAWRVWLPIGVFALLGVVIILLWWQWDALFPRFCQPLIDQKQAECQKQLEALESSQTPAPNESAPLLPPPPTSEPSEAERRWAEILGRFPVWPADLSSPKDCVAVQEDFLALIRELDSRPYIRSRRLPGGTLALVKSVSETLASQPPVASGELLRYESVVANVFHFFRTLGKERMMLLRQILAREEALEEPFAMALYRWLVSRSQCGDLSGRVDPELLYDYAAFLLNTLGGQAYIFRRSPRVAGLTTFYALLILDKAIQKGYNPHGVDPRPHIRRCRQLLSRADLVFTDRYLEVLQEIGDRWARR